MICRESVVPVEIVDIKRQDEERKKNQEEQMQEIKRRKLNGDFKNHNKLGQKNNLSKYFSSSSQNQNSQKQSNSSCSVTS